MSINKLRLTAGALWIAAMGAIGWASGTESTTTWVVIVALMLVPPVLLTRFWHAPAKSLSETIQDALR